MSMPVMLSKPPAEIPRAGLQLCPSKRNLKGRKLDDGASKDFGAEASLPSSKNAFQPRTRSIAPPANLRRPMRWFVPSPFPPTYPSYSWQIGTCLVIADPAGSPYAIGCLFTSKDVSYRKDSPAQILVNTRRAFTHLLSLPEAKTLKLAACKINQGLFAVRYDVAVCQAHGATGAMARYGSHPGGVPGGDGRRAGGV